MKGLATGGIVRGPALREGDVLALLSPSHCCIPISPERRERLSGLLDRLNKGNSGGTVVITVCNVDVPARELPKRG